MEGVWRGKGGAAERLRNSATVPQVCHVGTPSPPCFGCQGKITTLRSPSRHQETPLRLSFRTILSSAPLPWAHPCSVAVKCRATAHADNRFGGLGPGRHSALRTPHFAFRLPVPCFDGIAPVILRCIYGIAPLCIASPSPASTKRASGLGFPPPRRSLPPKPPR